MKSWSKIKLYRRKKKEDMFSGSDLREEMGGGGGGGSLVVKTRNRFFFLLNVFRDGDFFFSKLSNFYLFIRGHSVGDGEGSQINVFFSFLFLISLFFCLISLFFYSLFFSH